MNGNQNSNRRGTSGSDEARAEIAASEWIVRRRAGLDAGAEREFAAWLAADPENAHALARLAPAAKVFDQARASGATEIIRKLLYTRERRRRSRRVTAACGSLMALMLLGGLWLRRDSIPQAEIATQVAFDPVRRLPDGSFVELNAGAEIAIAYDATERRVELLRGEALFRVEKETARPFIVRAAGLDVRAVGTAFNVRIAPAALTVLVTEGRVRVDDARQGASLLPALPVGEAPHLVAGQEFSLRRRDAKDADLGPTITQVSAEQMENALSWRVSRLTFEGVSLADALQEINRRNRIQIVAADASLETLRVSGAFQADDPATFVRLIAMTFDLRVDRSATDRIFLHKK